MLPLEVTSADKGLETEVDLSSGSSKFVVCTVPAHSDVLVGSAAVRSFFNSVSRDPGSICAVDYNPLLNPSLTPCKTVYENPSLWFTDVIGPHLDLEGGFLHKFKTFNVSQDVARIFKEASSDLPEFAQCGYEFINHIVDSNIDVYRGVIKGCPLKEHCRVFFETTDLSYASLVMLVKFMYIQTVVSIQPLRMIARLGVCVL